MSSHFINYVNRDKISILKNLFLLYSEHITSFQRHTVLILDLGTNGTNKVSQTRIFDGYFVKVLPCMTRDKENHLYCLSRLIINVLNSSETFYFSST